MNQSLINDINAGVERSEAGVFIPRLKIAVGGVFTVEHVRKGEIIDVSQSNNIVTNEGLNHLLNVLFAGASQVNPWYVGIYNDTTTLTPAAGSVHTSKGGTEHTAYDENPNRPTYVDVVASQQATNSASKATFTINGADDNITGAFLASVQATGDSGAGTLLCESAFAAQRAVTATDQLLITYTITAADA